MKRNNVKLVSKPKYSSGKSGLALAKALSLSSWFRSLEAEKFLTGKHVRARKQQPRFFSTIKRLLNAHKKI